MVAGNNKRDRKKEYQKRWLRERRAKRKKAGLCTNCGRNPAVESRSTCQPCADKDATRHERNKARWRAEKRCVVCASNPAREDRLYCQPCADKHTARQRPLKRQRVAERIALRLCIRCGKEPHLETLSEAKQKLCERCYLMHCAAHNLGGSSHWETLKGKLLEQNLQMRLYRYRIEAWNKCLNRPYTSCVSLSSTTKQP